MHKLNSNPVSAKLHIGCGPKNIKDGWINIDIRKFPGVDLVMDVSQPWPSFGKISHIYAEHFLEHLSLNHAISFLTHASCNLHKDGRIRFSTPSLEWVLSTHFDLTKNSNTRPLSQSWAINRAFHGWGHKFLYSKEMLIEILSCTGFDNVTFHHYGESDDPHFIGIEQHGGYRLANEYPSVWICEATASTDNSHNLQRFLNDAQASFLKYVDSGH